MNGKYKPLILILLLALLLSGCNIDLDNESVRSGTDAMLQSLLAGDYDGAYSVVSANFSQDEFREPYQQIVAVLSGVETYTLTAVHQQKSAVNGIVRTIITYQMETNAGSYIVKAAVTEDVPGLSGFHIQMQQEIPVTGTLTTMQGADWIQWLVLIIGLAETAFVLCVLVDCLRHKFKRRWLWGLLILLGSAAFTCAVSSGGIRFNANYGFFLTLTSLIKAANGDTTLRIMVPVGAIIYLCSRKGLLRPVPPSADPESAEPPATAEPESNSMEPPVTAEPEACSAEPAQDE